MAFLSIKLNEKKTKGFVWVLICNTQLSTCCSQIKPWDFHPPKIAVQKQCRRCGSARPAFWLRSKRDTNTSSQAIRLLLKLLLNIFTHLIVKKNQNSMVTTTPQIAACSCLLSALTLLSELRSAEFSFRAANQRCCSARVSSLRRVRKSGERSVGPHCPCCDIRRIWRSRPCTSSSIRPCWTTVAKWKTWKRQP